MMILLTSTPLGGLAVLADGTPTVIDVVVQPLTLVEHTSGYWTFRSVTDPVTGREEWQEYWNYNNFSRDFRYTVTFEDGSVFESEGGWLDYGSGGSCLQMSENQSDAPWGVGMNTVPYEFLGYSGTAVVEIVESPVVSVAVDSVTLIENVSGSWNERYEWDEINGEQWVPFFYYDYVVGFTVTLKDGTVLPCDSGYCVEFGGKRYGMSYDDHQYDNPWDVGTHEVTYDLLGYTGTFDVEIVETPVQSVDFDPLTVIENVSGWQEYRYVYDEETGIGEHVPYFHYSYSPSYTVTLKDGTELVSEDAAVDYLGTRYYVSFNDRQTESPWGVGTHAVECSVLGYSATFDVEVIETPVASITVEPIQIIKNTNGYWMNKQVYDPETDSWEWTEERYWRYNYDPQFSVHLKDGTVLSCNGSWVEYEGQNYSILYQDTQSEEPWGVGTHTMECSVLGYTGSFDIEILDSPIVSVTVEPIELIVNTSGSWEYNPYYDEEV